VRTGLKVRELEKLFAAVAAAFLGTVPCIFAGEKLERDVVHERVRSKR
jgi:hypothetical protein